MSLVTAAEALADIRGYATAGRVEFTSHARVRLRQRHLRRDEVESALTQAHGCQPESGDRWRALCLDEDGPLDVVVVIEDGLLVVTVF